MITFLRKIRKSLIESGSTRKYLLYALGEITLVVIGILIALQINNWNESRKTEIRTHVLLNNIKEDLIADTIALHALIGEAEKLNYGIEGYYHYFEFGSWSTEEIIDSCLRINVEFLRYLPNNPTYIDIISSGNTNLLSEDLRRGLANLKIFQDRLAIITDRNIADTKNSLYEIGKYWDSDGIVSDFYEKTGLYLSEDDLLRGLKHNHDRLKFTQIALKVMKGSSILFLSKSLIQIIDADLDRMK